MRKTDNSYTAVQMEEKKSKEEREHDLEEPFNEEFWLKVSHLLLPLRSALVSGSCGVLILKM